MRFSKLFGKTLRQAPAEADSISHQLLVRAGMVDQIATGVYSYLPSGWRTLRKIERIVRQEMDRAGGQELSMPSLQPVELWDLSGRHEAFGKTLFTFKDRKEHTLVLGPTHEEVVTELVHRHLQSYKELPLLLYQIQNKFRDEPRPRGGLLRVREFIMKDLYSFDADLAGLDRSYKKMIEAYNNIYRRCGLPAVMVEADSGAIGGKDSHEFMLIAETGEDEIIRCHNCGYTANAEKAEVRKTPSAAEEPLPIQEISTPGVTSIADLARLLNMPESKTLKAVMYMADGNHVLSVIRGDMDVNEVKLKNMLKCADLRMATDEDLKGTGIVAGYASPVGLKGVKVVADESIMMGNNFVAGANRRDTHLKNVNYPRDFQIDIMGDIARAKAGHECPRCGHVFLTSRGIEVGHVFKLGTFLSEKLGAYFLDENGEQRPCIMGCYGIGLGRLLAAAVEQNHDEKGIIWPLPIAPHQVYLCPLFLDNTEVASEVERVYNEMVKQGIEVLYDDRVESAGIKFNDADLLGLPIRVTVSPRTLKSKSAEFKLRAKGESELVPLGEIANRVKQEIAAAADT
ncbi:MAG: proline--tRNA ligase [Chloroflexi bacterium]|nr:proline--tRNA ligase [Chloroflexota bacterium]